MPHDGTPRNGRMHESGVPHWVLALALAIVFSAVVTLLGVPPGLLILLLPALAIVAAGCGIYAAIAARRRRSTFDFGPPHRRRRVIEDERTLRRGSRLSGQTP